MTSGGGAFPNSDALRDELYQGRNSVPYIIAEIAQSESLGFLPAQYRYVTSVAKHGPPLIPFHIRKQSPNTPMANELI